MNFNLTSEEELKFELFHRDAEENVATPDWQNNAPLIPSPFTELTSNCDNSDPVPQNTVYGPLLPYPSLSECENLFSLPDETPDDTAAGKQKNLFSYLPLMLLLNFQKIIFVNLPN